MLEHIDDGLVFALLFATLIAGIWLCEREKTKKINAEARLQEAKNAATRPNPTGGKDA